MGYITREETEKGWRKLVKGGKLPKSREAWQGVFYRTHKNALRESSSNIDQKSKSHSETGLANGNSPAPLSVPLFPCSDYKGVRIPGQQAGEEKPGTKRNFTLNQA